MPRLVTVRYIQANNGAQHDRARARYGIPPSTHKAMDAFLLSPQLAKPVLSVAATIAASARALAAELLYSDQRSGAYEASIAFAMQAPIVVNGYPRVRGAVYAHGGYAHWSGPIGPGTSHAAVVEFDIPEGSSAGPRPRRGRRILGLAGAPFHSPKGTPT